MTSYSPIELRALFRASHSSIWELADGAGILDDLNILLVSLDPCPTSAIAEAVLTEGAVDLVSGNHVTLYGKVARGEPLVRGPSTFVHENSQFMVAHCGSVVLRGAVQRSSSEVQPQ